MNFQGKLMDSSGNVMPDGTYNMRMRIYDAESGGALLWSSERLVSAGEGVTVTNGLFTIRVGRLVPLDSTLFDGSNDLFFEVELPSAATATSSSPAWTEGPMTPRNQLATSAYAFNADQLDGLDSDAFGQIAANNLFTGTNTINVASSAAFGVVNGAASLFTVDTTSSQIVIGQSDTTGALFVLDTKTDPGDPTGSDGAMYYNSDSGKFRCYEGAWKNCITNLQDAYDNSTSPATITTTSASKGVGILAGTAPDTDLLSIDTNGHAVSTNNANGLRVNYEGGSGAIEGSGIRVDYAPGGTSGSTWNGLGIVSDANGPSSGVTSYGLKLEGPSISGGGSAVGIGVAGGFDIGVDVASGGLQLAEMSDPSAPTTNSLKVYAKDVAGKTVLKIKGPSGLDTALQSALYTNNVAMLLPSTGTTVTVWGMQNSTVGTASTPSITNSSLATSMRRVRVTSASTANAAAELRSTKPLVWRGNSSGLGGFFYAVRFSINSTTANQRLFSGLTAATGATSTSVSPSSLVNMVGVGWDSADSNLQIMSNNNMGTAAKVDLGSSFPTNDTSAVYELVLFAPPNGSTIGYRVSRLETGDTTSGTLSGDIPQNTVMLTHHQYMNNGGTAAAAVLEVNRVYIESDY